jgi:hypothetical protein
MGDIGERATHRMTGPHVIPHARIFASSRRRPIVANRDVNPKGKMIWEDRRIEMTVVLGRRHRRVSEIKAEYRAMRYLAG